MAPRYPLTVHVPIRGKVLLRIDGTDALHEIGEFTQDVAVAFTPGPGEVTFQYEKKFWEANVKDKADPRPAAGIVQEAIVENLQRWGTRAGEPGKLDIDGTVDVLELSAKIVAALEKEGRLRA